MQKPVHIITWLAGMMFFITGSVALAAPSWIFQRSIIPEITSRYELGTTTKTWLTVFTDNLCLNGDCRSAWPTGGGGGGSGGAWATTTNNILTYLSNQWTALIGGTATTSNDRLEVHGGVTAYGTITAANFTATSSATSTFPVAYLGTSTVSNLNGVIYVDGVRFAKTSSGINSAISSCPSTSCVVFLYGDYDITSPITFNGKDNVKLIGQGGTTTRLIVNATFSGSYIIDDTSLGLYKNDEIGFLYFDSHNKRSASIRIGTSTNLYVHDNTFTGVRTPSIWGVKIGTGNVATYSANNFSDNVRFENNTFIDNDFGTFEGLLAVQWRNSTINGNYVTTSTSSNAYMLLCYLFCDTVDMSKNRINNSGGHAIGAQQSTRITMNNNQIIMSGDGYRGFTTVNVTNSQIKNNTVYGNHIGTGVFIFDRDTGADGNANQYPTSTSIDVSGNTFSGIQYGINMNTGGSGYKTAQSNINFSNNTYEDIDRVPIDIGYDATNGDSYGLISIENEHINSWHGSGVGAIRMRGASTTPNSLRPVVRNNYIAPATPYATGQVVSDNIDPSDGDTITVGSITYRFKTVMSAPYDIQLTGTASTTLVNLVAGVNATTTGSPQYFSGTIASTEVTASKNISSATTTDFTAKNYGSIGLSIVTSVSSSHLSFSHATLLYSGNGISIIWSNPLVISGNTISGTNLLGGSYLAFTNGTGMTANGLSIFANTLSTSSDYGTTFQDNIGNIVAVFSSSTGYFGLGTTSPYAKLSVAGQVVASYFTATSTATSTFRGVRADCFSVDGVTCLTSSSGSGASSTLLIDGNNFSGTNTFAKLIATNATTTGAQYFTGSVTKSTANDGDGYLGYSGSNHVFSLVREPNPSNASLSISALGAIGMKGGQSSPFTGATPYDLIITNGGNVGIATNTPDQKIVVNGNIKSVGFGSDGAFIGAYNGGTHIWSLSRQSSPSNASLDISSFGGIGFSVGATGGISTTYSAVLTSAGLVGIGTTSPYSKLSVAGQIVGQNFVATSTTDTSSFWGNLISLGSTTIQNLNSASSTLGTWLAGNGTTTNLAVTSLNAVSCDVKAQTNGSLYCGTDATGAGGGVWPFVGSSNYSVNVQSTSTPLWFTGTAGVYASGTSYFNNLNIQYPSGTGVPFTIYANTSNVNTTMIENSGGDATLSVRSDAGYGAAWINLYSTAAEYQGITSYISDVLSWRIGNSGANSGLSIFVGSALNELVRFYNNMTVNINGRLGIASSTPWASFSLVSTTTEGILTPAMVIATSTDLSSVGFFAYWRPTAITPKWWDIHIGGATSSSRYDKDNITTFGQQNSDTLMVNVDPMTVALGASLTEDSVVTSVGPGAVFDEITDGNFSITSFPTSTLNITGGPTGITNGCNDGGPWIQLKANELTGAVADEGAWLRGSMVSLPITTSPTASQGGTLTASGTPTMEVTICTPTVTNAYGTSTTVMPAIYAFGFGDSAFGTTFAGSAVRGPANGSFIIASTTDNWWLVSTNANVGVKTNTGVSTSSTRSNPTTFRLSMTATATYAWKYDNNTGTWGSIGVQTTQQTKRDFTWFIGVQNPGTAGIRSDFLFRNLKVWYSPTYRF